MQEETSCHISVEKSENRYNAVSKKSAGHQKNSLRGKAYQREGERVNSSQSWVKNSNMTRCSPVYKLDKHLPQSPFTGKFCLNDDILLWCLYG
jgi:hypothetical protein